MRNLGTLAAIVALAGAPAALGLAACSPPEEEGEARQAIAGGAVDVEDRGVVGLVVSGGAGSPRRTCTGTLIAPDLVLTAQHCVADAGPVVDCATSTFGPVAAPDRVRVTAAASLWSTDSLWTAAAAVRVPPGPRSLCGRDVALVELAEPLPGPVHPPRLEPVDADEAYAAVGYGAVDGADDGAGLRRRRERLRVLCVGAGCGTPQIDAAEWRGDHGVCSGDSGGPALDAEGRVIGVTSRGPRGCERPVYGALSAHAAWLRAWATRAASAGDEPPPSWCGPAAPPPLTLPPPASCATAAPRPAAGVLPLWGALALAAWRRRASSRRAPG